MTTAKKAAANDAAAQHAYRGSLLRMRDLLKRTTALVEARIYGAGSASSGATWAHAETIEEIERELALVVNRLLQTKGETVLQLPSREGLHLQMGKQFYPVKDLADATARFQKFRGSKSSRTCPSARVLRDGKEIAHISYNGRVWPAGAEHYTKGATPILEADGTPFVAGEKEF